jgi:colicin import membrane protein
MTQNQIEIILQDQREIELLEKSRKVNLQKLFTPEGMDLIIAEIENEVADFQAFHAVVETKEGRAKIISMAAKVAKCKAPIKNLAAELKEESRRLIDGVNSQWNRYEEAMDTLRDQIRKPVDEIEEAEAKILAERKERIERIKNHGMLYNSTLHDIKIAMKNVEKILDFENWGEFQFAAENAAKEVLQNLENLHKQKEEQIKKDQELEQLRAEAAERARKDHEAAIAAEAARKAKFVAEMEAAKKAKELRETAEREKLEAEQARLKIEEEKRLAEKAKINAELRAKEAERLAIEQAEKAELARIAAEKKAKEDAEKAAAEAVKKEQERVAEEKRLADLAAEKLAANKNHCEKIESEIAASLEFILNAEEEGAESFETISKKIVAAIARGEVSHVQINY